MIDTLARIFLIFMATIFGYAAITLYWSHLGDQALDWRVCACCALTMVGVMNIVIAAVSPNK